MTIAERSMGHSVRLEQTKPPKEAVSPGWAALAVYAVCLPVAWVLPGALHINPFNQRGGLVPLAVGGLIVAAVGVAAWLLRGRYSGMLVGASAGFYAAFVVLVLRTALNGTPYAHEALLGDTGRLYAMAERYTTAWAAHDGVVGTVASEYPPGFPYLIGKLAWLLHLPAWHLVKPAEIITLSLAVLVPFWLWLRLVSAPAALMISVLVSAVAGIPSKSYEIVALAVAIPWLLLTVARPDGKRLHWLPAGLIGTVLLQTYFTPLAFVAIGMLVLAVSVWRTEPDRKAYVWYLVKVCALALALAAWWWIPYLWAMAHGGQQVADQYWSQQNSEFPFPFLETNAIGLAELAGLAGMLWLRGRTFWAGPLLLMLLGCYAYRVIGLIRWVATQHTMLFYYTDRMIEAICMAGLALSAVELAKRRDLVTGAGLVAALAGVTFAGYTFWTVVAPVTSWGTSPYGGANPNDPPHYSNINARQAHAETLPNGRLNRYAKIAHVDIHRLPTNMIIDAVRQVRPGDPVPQVLSRDQTLFGYVPWNSYLDTDRTASYGPVHWDERYAELLKLAKMTDPAAFAQEAANTPFGPINVFVLGHRREGMAWPAFRVKVAPTFSAQQFEPARWDVRDLPNDTFLAIRIPGT